MDIQSPMTANTYCVLTRGETLSLRILVLCRSPLRIRRLPKTMHAQTRVETWLPMTTAICICSRPATAYLKSISVRGIQNTWGQFRGFHKDLQQTVQQLTNTAT